MIRQFRIVSEAAIHLAAAANGSVEALAQGRVEQEPAFTDRMLGRIELAMEGYSTKGIRWSAKTLTDRAPNSQEREFGADFAGVLDIDIQQFEVTKGFLVHAKLIEPSERMRADERRRMVDQCATMLEYTPESFVLLYSVEGSPWRQQSQLSAQQPAVGCRIHTTIY